MPSGRAFLGLVNSLVQQWNQDPSFCFAILNMLAFSKIYLLMVAKWLLMLQLPYPHMYLRWRKGQFLNLPLIKEENFSWRSLADFHLHIIGQNYVACSFLEQLLIWEIELPRLNWSPPRHLKVHVHWASGHTKGDQDQGSIIKELGQVVVGWESSAVCYKHFLFEQHTSNLI